MAHSTFFLAVSGAAWFAQCQFDNPTFIADWTPAVTAEFGIDARRRG
jgi:hypothetical protein